MRKPTRKQIEKVSESIRFLVPVNGTYDLQFKNNALSSWTPKGLRTMDWPKEWSSAERRLIRQIAKTALMVK